MRVFLQDCAGHPFQHQLARALAENGHTVLFATLKNFESPNMLTSGRASQTGRFALVPVCLKHRFRKYSLWGRLVDECAYAQSVVNLMGQFHPDVVLSGVASPIVQWWLLRHAKIIGAGFVLWVQDLYGLALQSLLSRKTWLLGRLIGHCISNIERRIAGKSDRVIVISDDFLPLIGGGSFRAARCLTIPNWAPLDEISVGEKHNPWAVRQGLHDKAVVMYSGTLGLKHDPQLLVDLALRFRRRPDVRVVVISEGRGRTWLECQKSALGLDNLILFDYQPSEEYSAVLATADILLASIDPQAAEYCVPSKVLTYLCAGRSIVAAIPLRNHAAKVLRESQGAIVLEPGQSEELVSVIAKLVDDSARMALLGSRGREFATAKFDIGRIAAEFEKILVEFCPAHSRASRPSLPGLNCE